MLLEKSQKKIRNKISRNRLLTYLLMLIIGVYMIGVFLFKKVSFGTEEIRALGGLNSSANSITLILSLFVHSNLLHLLSNVMGTVLLWTLLKGKYKDGLIVATFILSGLVGNVISVNMQPEILTYGASGCVMGLMGMFFSKSVIVEIASGVDQKRKVDTNLVLFGTLISIMFIWLTGDNENINLISHTVGFCTGVVCGLLFEFVGVKKN